MCIILGNHTERRRWLGERECAQERERDREREREIEKERARERCRHLRMISLSSLRPHASIKSTKERIYKRY